MTTYSTDTHGPAATAPTTTGLVAICDVCHVQWQVQGPNNEDAKSCDFCGAGGGAITIVNENANHPETNIVGFGASGQ